MNTKTPEQSAFLVWWDAFLEEWMVCPDADASPSLRQSLAALHTTIHTIDAPSALDALDAVRPKRQHTASRLPPHTHHPTIKH